MPNDKDQTRKLKFCKFCKKRVTEEILSIVDDVNKYCICKGVNLMSTPPDQLRKSLGTKIRGLMKVTMRRTSS